MYPDKRINLYNSWGYNCFACFYFYYINSSFITDLED